MKMFIWDYVNGLTVNYHSGGGLVVVAATVERAREIAPGEISDDPDHTYELAGDVEEKTVIFPDQGCC